MINSLELNVGKDLIQLLFQVMRLVAWKENTLITDVLDEGVSGVTIGFNGGHQNCSVLVRHFGRRVKGDCSIGYSMLVDGLAVFNEEADVLDTVSMINKVLVHLLRTIFIVN